MEPGTPERVGLPVVPCDCADGKVGVDEAAADDLLAKDHADRTVGPVPPALPEGALPWTLAALAAVAALVALICLR